MRARLSALRAATAAVFLLVPTLSWAGETIPARIAANPDLSTFGQVLKASGLESSLNEPGPFTVFVPDNGAFSTLSDGSIAVMLDPANRSSLANMLRSHVIAGSLAIAPGKTLSMAKTTLSGTEVLISVDAEASSIDNAYIVSERMDAANGVIYVIDEVLFSEAFDTETDIGGDEVEIDYGEPEGREED